MLSSSGAMTRRVVAVGALVVFAAHAPCASSAILAQPYWQQDVHYTLDVRVDDRAHDLDGREQIEYTNNSPDTLVVLWLHLYPNAFRSVHSTFMRDRLATDSWVVVGVPARYRHWMDVRDVLVEGDSVEPHVD